MSAPHPVIHALAPALGHDAGCEPGIAIGATVVPLRLSGLAKRSRAMSFWSVLVFHCGCTITWSTMLNALLGRPSLVVVPAAMRIHCRSTAYAVLWLSQVSTQCAAVMIHDAL